MPTARFYTPDEPNSGGEAATVTAPGRENGPATCGVRYGAMNWIGEFRLPARLLPQCDAKVVIQTDRGIELGNVSNLLCHSREPSVAREQVKAYIDNSGTEFYRFRAGKILREASEQDINEHLRLNEHVREDINRCAETASQTNLDMKIITAEHLLGGERIVFYFRSEGRIDFRDLVRALAQYYQTRIEMRQVGARDEARLIADYEICGRQCCCKNFLKKLRPVTMRMAKLQKSTLDPSKVSGRCGRLRCCLRYEHDGYDELLRRLPRIGARLETEIGPATVVDRQVLTQMLMVRGEDGQTVAIPLDETAPLGTAPPKPAPEEEPAPVESRFEPVLEAEAKESESTEQTEKSRRRRRPRRRRKSADTKDNTGGSTAASPPEPAPTQEMRQEPKSEDKTDDEPRPTRKRRRRRRSSRRKPGDSSPEKG